MLRVKAVIFILRVTVAENPVCLEGRVQALARQTHSASRNTNRANTNARQNGGEDLTKENEKTSS